MPRYSLLHLLTVVLFAALGFTALLNASEWLVSLFALITFLSILSEGVLAIYRTESARAFWAGFVLFGGACFAIGLGTNMNESTRHVYFTSRAISWLHKQVSPQREHVVWDRGFHWPYLHHQFTWKLQYQRTDLTDQSVTESAADVHLRREPSGYWNFFRVGQCLATLVCGYAGGVFMRAGWRRWRQEPNVGINTTLRPIVRRLSIHALTAGMFAAVSVLSLLRVTLFWAASVQTATIVVLLASVVFAAYSSAARRSFWSAFAAIGWAFFLLAPLVGEKLFTYQSLGWAYEQLYLGGDERMSLALRQRGVFPFNDLSLAEKHLAPSFWFMTAGQSLWILLLAYIGAAMAAILTATGRHRKTAT